MKKLSKPGFNVDDVVLSCVESIRNRSLANRLVRAIPVLAKEEAAYASHGRRGMLHRIKGSEDVNGSLSAKEMAKLYKGTLSRSGSESRRLYDRIKMSSPMGICPLCNQRVVSTLDHHLPKTSHPGLSLTPLNLVPACSDCNKEKLHRVAKRVEDQTLHPYYDDVDTDRWLHASVQESAPPAVLFYVADDCDFDEVTLERVRTHFETFKLAKLYSAQAAAELASIEHLLFRLGKAGGGKKVKKYLKQQANDRLKAAKNSWIAATYSALAESAWFCHEGYALLRTNR